MNGLLSSLRDLGVEISEEDGKLRVDAPQGVLSKELVQELRENKAALLEALRHGGLPVADAPAATTEAKPTTPYQMDEPLWRMLLRLAEKRDASPDELSALLRRLRSDGARLLWKAEKIHLEVEGQASSDGPGTRLGQADRDAIRSLLSKLSGYHSAQAWLLPLPDGEWHPVPPPAWAGSDLAEHRWFAAADGSLMSVV